MKTIRWILVLVISFLAFGMVGCDTDERDGHYHRYRYYDYNGGYWVYYDNGYEFNGSPNGPPLEGWPDNTGNYYDANNSQPYTYVPPVNQNQPSAIIESEGYISLNNQWTSPLTFVVDGIRHTVNPGYSESQNYTGSITVTVEGYPWVSWTWSDGSNHSVTAVNGQVSSIPDFNAN